MKSKPDCTGQRFGRLVVLGKGSKRKRPDRNSYVQLWELQCDCGKIIELRRGDFDRKTGRSQVSCGCKRKLGLVDNKQRPTDISGQKFGDLTAISLTGDKVHKKLMWLLQCCCGNNRLMSLSLIRQYQKLNQRLNCGNKSKHPEKSLHYPPIPCPYPESACELLKKYLHLTELDFKQINSAVEDEKRDRLLRVAWIITYRRAQGEQISELHEKRIILKHLRYCTIDVFWQRRLDAMGGFLLTQNGKKLGSTMTNTTSENYPVLETLGINMLPSSLPIKKIKFKRC